MKLRVYDSDITTGKINMETDIQLAKSCNPDEAILRFYRWSPYCISLGANQKIEEINLEKTKHDNIDVVYRPTGGRAILHAEELTYSVIYPLGNSLSFRSLYHEINVALIRGLTEYDASFSALEMESIQPEFQNLYKEQLGTLCFAVPAKSEIKYAGRKLIGSAQKKLKHTVLQHGSIICGDYHLRVIDYLNLPKENILQIKQQLSIKTTDLFSILKRTINYSELANSLIQGFKKHFDFEIEAIYKEEFTL